MEVKVNSAYHMYSKELNQYHLHAETSEANGCLWLSHQSYHGTSIITCKRKLANKQLKHKNLSSKEANKTRSRPRKNINI